MTFSRLFRTVQQCALLACAAWLSVGVAQAQSVYRVVGPDGKVTFSDRAPETATASAARAPAARAPAGELPYELRQVAQRFPVTLYTGDNCAPCGNARNLLLQRGVPFVERTVNTNQDIEALQRLSGSNNLPFGTIGGQQLVGFSQAEWAQYLDAAGYPKKSSLPSNYRNSTATPLVAVKTVELAPKEAAAPAAASSTPSSRPAVPSGGTPTNPAGITF